MYQKLKPLLIIVSLIFLFCSGGCATLTTGTSQSIFVDTPKVKGAECRLTDSNGKTSYLPHTPGNVTVPKGDGPMSVVCEKEGYENGIASVDETIEGATFGNILIGGGIGILIDAMTGAAQVYPDSITIWMKPEKWKSREQEEQWERAYQARQEAIKKEEEEIEAAEADCDPGSDSC